MPAHVSVRALPAVLVLVALASGCIGAFTGTSGLDPRRGAATSVPVTLRVALDGERRNVCYRMSPARGDGGAIAREEGCALVTVEGQLAPGLMGSAAHG